MGCCGQKRAVASRPPTAPPNTTSVHAASPTVPTQDMVEVEYLAQSPVLVRGPITGITYQFSAAAPIQKVHRGDTPVLLATRYFRLAIRLPSGP